MRILDRLRSGALRTPRGQSRGLPSETDKLWYFQQVNLFKSLSEAEAEWLARVTTMREYARGAVVSQPALAADVVHLIKRGKVKVSTYSREGKQQILAILGVGDLFGEGAMVGVPKREFVEALEDCVVCNVPAPIFLDLLRARPDLALRVMFQLTERVRHLEHGIQNLAFREVPARLASTVLRLLDTYGEQVEGGRALALRLTHQDLAAMIGATRETVTLTLNRFREDGLIAVEERRITVLDEDGLRRLAGRADDSL